MQKKSVVLLEEGAGNAVRCDSTVEGFLSESETCSDIVEGGCSRSRLDGRQNC